MTFFENISGNNRRQRLLRHGGFWIAILLLSVSYGKYSDRDKFSFILTLATCSIFLFPQILASYFLAYLIIPRFIYRKKYWAAAALFIAGSYLICVLARFLIIHAAEPIAGEAPKAFETIREIVTNVLKLLYVYFFPVFSIAFVFLLLKFLKDQNEIQKRALSLEKEKAETELKMLKAQLNPHFLFNTLNNIYSLSLDNSPLTATSIARLSEILDYVLFRCNHSYMPIEGEIILLQNYIELEKLRYDERLRVNFTTFVDGRVTIAPLLLLSITENAFKHGAGNETGHSFIHIDLRSTPDSICFKVANSHTSNGKNKTNGKIGLSNLKRQLDLIYAKRYTLDITQTDDIFSVLLHLNVTME